MDARTSAAAICLCCLLTIAGCPQLNHRPAARPEESESPPPEQGIIVQKNREAADVQPAADIEPDMDVVQRWIEQIRRRDDLRSRVEPPLPRPTTTQPAESRYQEDVDESVAAGAAGSPDSPASRPTTGPATPADSAQRPDATKLPKDTPPASGRPTLASASARAGASLDSARMPRRDVMPAVNAPAAASHSPLTLNELVDQWLARPNDSSFRDQLDRRLLQVLAGKYEEARQPLELVSGEQQQMARQFIEALIAIRESHGGDPGEEANRVLAQLRQLEESLVPLSHLHIPNLVLTRAVRGFGRYEAFDPPHFPAGRENELVVYCEVENFVSRPTGNGRYESQFSMRTTLLSRAGDTVLEINDEHIVDECRARRHDCFIPRLIRLPATLSPGQYVVKVTIIDKIGSKVAEKRTTLRIVARS